MPPFANLETVIKSAAGVVAIIPGVALMLAAVVLPVSLQQMLGGLSLTLGIIIVLSVYLFGKEIQRLSPRRIGAIVLVAFVLGAATAIFSQQFAKDHILTRHTAAGETEMLVIPMRPRGPLADYTRRYQGDYDEALRHPIIGPDVRRQMERQSGSAVWVMAISFLLFQALILVALLVAAWKVADTLQRRRSTGGGRRRSDPIEAPVEPT